MSKAYPTLPYVRELAKKTSDFQDAALSEYVKAMCNHLERQGKDLSEYVFVTYSGQISVDEGSIIRSGIEYAIKHRDEVQHISFPEDER